eukprot:scaffold10312_cov149-Amphora_coffeaeformis.AAC.4
MKSSVEASKTEKTAAPPGTTAIGNAADLESFLRPNAAEVEQGKVDWGNMSRGAFSTVSKMKSAVEKMNNTNTNSKGNGRLHKASGDSLGLFLKRGAANATVISSDDRSRGAHSTMSHNLRREERKPPKRGIHTSDHVSPFFQVTQGDKLPSKAEQRLPTGNPKAMKYKAPPPKQRSDKAQKNLELFMSRQKPLPKQDLEVRSAFTSVDQKRKSNPFVIPATGAIPLPTSKEDLLRLLKAAAMAPAPTSTTATTAAATKKSPKVGTNNKKGIMEQPPSAPTLSQNSQPALVKTHVACSSSSGLLSQSSTSTAQPTNSQKGEPSRQVRRTISASSATGNSAKKPLKRTKSSQKCTKGPEGSGGGGGGVPQFSSLLSATATQLDKPQPILATPSPCSTNNKEGTILRSLSATDVVGNNPSAESSNKAAPKAQKSPTANNENITNQKITTRGLRKEVEGPRQKKASTSGDDHKAATKTKSQIMSARRLHHVPANSIPQSPIAGRRQSLKMGLAGTASGEGQSRGAKTAVKRKKTKPAAAAPKKASAALPTVPGMDHGGSSSDMGDASKAATAAKRNRPAIRRTDGGASGEARRSIRGRRTTATKTEFEDVFSFYQWSESRQAESKIMAERQILRDAIMDGGPLHRAFNRIA